MNWEKSTATPFVSTSVRSWNDVAAAALIPRGPDIREAAKALEVAIEAATVIDRRPFIDRTVDFQ